MKKWIYLVMLSLCLFLSACKKDWQTGVMQLEDTIDPTAVSAEDETINNDELEYILSLKVQQSDTEDSVKLDENVTIEQKMAGKLMGMDAPESTVYILGINADSSKKHTSYLAVVLQDVLVLQDLNTMSHNDSLYLADVDGNGLDEIVLHQELDSFGGAGQYLSRVYRLENDKFCEIFNSSTSAPINAKSGIYDTGFSGELLAGKKLAITNESVGYRTTIDISERYTDDFFDDQGNGPSHLQCSCDSFFSFEPKDADGDGIAELVGKQYMFLFNHADGIGYGITVLKYNRQTESFLVVDAKFVAQQH